MQAEREKEKESAEKVEKALHTKQKEAEKRQEDKEWRTGLEKKS